MTDRYFGIAESRLAAVRPKRSVLEGIVPLPQRRRGRPTDKPPKEATTSDAVTTRAVVRAAFDESHVRLRNANVSR